jgi:hypothetical protein
MQKVNSLNDNYENRWFFVVTDKNLTAQYNKFGKTYDKRYLASVFNRLVNKKPVVQPTGH